jgi:DNA-binding CsgD family transcriptional regulator
MMDIASVSKSFMDAALDPQLWTKAMDDVSRFAKASGATLLPVRGRMPDVPTSASLADGIQIYFRDGWHLKDERERGLPIMRERGIFTDQDFASREETQKSDYYQGFLATFDANWSAGIGIKIADEEWALMLQRGDRSGPFELTEQKNLLQLAGPLQQAALVAHSLSFGRAMGVADAFDMVGRASLLIDRYGKVLRANRQAERHIGTHLLVSRGELSCFRGQETNELRKMVHGLCFGLDRISAGVRSVVISRKERRPLLVQGVALENGAGDYFGAARAVLLIVDPFREQESVPAAEIRRGLGLTKAEATLLMLLHADVSLPQAAEQLGVSYETVRTQLKSIFDRTGVRRQSEALHLVHNLTGGLRVD